MILCYSVALSFVHVSCRVVHHLLVGPLLYQPYASLITHCIVSHPIFPFHPILSYSIAPVSGFCSHSHSVAPAYICPPAHFDAHCNSSFDCSILICSQLHVASVDLRVGAGISLCMYFRNNHAPPTHLTISSSLFYLAILFETWMFL